MSYRPKPYPAYKDSSVPWLGEVPEHWEIRRLKQVCRLAYGDTLASEVRQDGNVPVYGSNGRVGFHSIPNTLPPCLVIGRKGSFGKVNFSSEAVFAIDTTYYVDARTSSGDIRWLYYLFGWLRLDEVSKDSAIPGLAREDAYQRLVPLPPLADQPAIVRYLDYMDRRIQRYIRAKQKLIRLLEEQKQAIIHQAVTGQIDVRTGKPYPTYKPSGVEWLGEVPEHWEVNPLCRVLVQRKEKNDPIKTTNILSLSLKAGVIPYADKEAGGNKAKEDLSAYMLTYPGDIVVNSMNVVVGSVGLSKYFGAVSPVYYMLRPLDPDGVVEYFSTVFQDLGFQRSLFGLGNGILYIESKSSGKLNTIRLRIPMTRLKRVLLPRPPSVEQTAVVGHLREVIADGTATRNHTEREIDLLRDYRTRLISDVVTGKLDVREAAANLPEELEEEPEEDQEPEDEENEDFEDEASTEDEG